MIDTFTGSASCYCNLHTTNAVQITTLDTYDGSRLQIRRLKFHWCWIAGNAHTIPSKRINFYLSENLKIITADFQIILILSDFDKILRQTWTQTSTRNRKRNHVSFRFTKSREIFSRRQFPVARQLLMNIYQEQVLAEVVRVLWDGLSNFVIFRKKCWIYNSPAKYTCMWGLGQMIATP